MSVAGLVDLPLELFSGLVTDLAAADLPAGASPAQADCTFILGGVLTRPGIGTGVITGLAGAASVNYLKTFTDLQENERMLFLDTLGIVRQEFPQGTLTVLNPAQPVIPGAYGQSDTLFGREYLAYSDGKFGLDIPRQWDTANYDRVSQCGVGAPPSGVADVSSGITSIQRVGGIISVTTAAPHGLAVGGLVTINSVAGDPTLNGTWPVATVPSPTTFTAWGQPGTYVINNISRAGNVVTAILAAVPFIVPVPGAQIVVGGVDDASFDGLWTVQSVSGNQVKWNQVAANAVSTGGTLYTESITLPLVSILAASTNNYLVVANLQPGQSSPFVVGATTTIAGNTAGAFNKTWVVEIVDPTGNTIHAAFSTSNPGGSLGAGGYGGTITLTQPDSHPAATGLAGPAGHIAAGIHQLVVMFITRQGYITKPSPPTSWLAAGGFTCKVTGIPLPTNLTNVVGRILAFTTSGGATFFYLSANDARDTDMIIMDAVTTTATVDFDDTVLANGQDITNIFTLLELGECAGVIGYSSRLFWWGERNKVSNFLNLTFDGGFSGNVPLGWTLDPTSGAGGSPNSSPIWGAAYNILGDGATAVRGRITQSAYQDYLGVTIIGAGVAYSVRVRTMAVGALTQGTLQIELYSPSLATSYGKFSVTTAQVNVLPAGQLGEFIGSIGSVAIPPVDLQLRVYVDGTPTAAAGFQVDDIEPFPTLQPYNTTLPRASYVEDPESYSSVTGFLNVWPENGQAVRAAFVLREKLYWVKERSLYATQDDGQNEPNDWTIDEISNKVGTFSVHGVDVGEEWAIIAARQGVYIFWGPEPVKISQEIQPTWNTINWIYGHRIWVRIDDVNKRVLVGAPINGATTPNCVFMFDYRGIDTAQEIAEHWTVRYSSYTGKILAIGNAPKWSPWNMRINSAALIERNDGTAHMFLGNGAGTGKIYDLLDPQQPGSGGVYNDDGAGIPWTYTTYYAPGHQDEQALKLGSHRKLYAYLTGLVEGSGQMDIIAQPIGNITTTKIATLNLVNVGAPAATTGIVRMQGTTTVTCAGGHGLTSTDTQAVLAGNPDQTTNGTFPILQILNAKQFTIAQLYLPNIATGGGGSVTRLLRDFEYSMNVFGERVSFTLSNHGNTPNTWFKLQKLVMSMKEDPWAPVRGGN